MNRQNVIILILLELLTLMITNHKLLLYKENIIKFIKTENDTNNINNINNLDELDELDYIIGILFLTEMNRYCKKNNINIHGYYIASSIINLFNKIKKKLLTSEQITLYDINYFWLSISQNIDYLNSRIDSKNSIRQKINNNFCKFYIEINNLLINLVDYHKNHKTQELNRSGIYCNKRCYICWVDNILSKFIYILLITAKFIGLGEIKDPNLYKLSEYYSNIIYTYLKIDYEILNNYKKEDNSEQNTSDNISDVYNKMFDNYIENKNKLYYSLIELKINSDTVDEIINYLDNYIINNLNIKNK